MKTYLKKVSALFIAFVMMLAMSVPAFAENVAMSTKINNLGENAVVKILQVIGEEPTSKTGWTFVNGLDAYKEAFDTTDDQKIIVALIKAANANATVPSEYADVAAATSEQIDKALSKLNINEFKIYDGTLEETGLYALDITEEGYTYKRMAIYYEFGETTTNPVEAKKAPIEINKENTGDAEDNAAGIGSVVSYKITSNIPYIDSLKENKTYTVSDKLTGAEYKKETLKVNISNLGDVTKYLDDSGMITWDETENSFKVDLSEYITNDNANANQKVEITYDAIVTGTEVKNEASHTWNDGSDSDETKVYTGTIVLTKVDADTDDELAGAGFKVTMTEDKDSNPVTDGEYLTFTKIEDGVYEYKPKGSEIEVFTNDSGTLTLKGLDQGKYHFEETTAPKGYSINENGGDAELTYENEIAQGEFRDDDVVVKDSKHASLPSTGGMGTYLFTIVGVVIMAAAAGMLFMKRRGEAE